MKKSDLPKNWVVCSSRSYPDKVYYFNTVTNKKSWELPVGETEDEQSPKKANSKKRKKGEDSEASRPKTPELTQEEERPVLQAKRRISLIPETIAKETPQMREIREKLMEKQAKLTKAIKPKTDTSNKQLTTKQLVEKIVTAKAPEQKVSASRIPDTEIPEVAIIKSPEIKVPENIAPPPKARGRYSLQGKTPPRKPNRRQSTIGSESSTKDEVPTPASPAPTAGLSMTPQMRLLYEKIEQKKALKAGSPRKSLAGSVQSPSSSSTTSSSLSSSSTSGSSSSSSSSSTTTSATSSKTSSKTRSSKGPPEPIQNTQNAITTRRRSRLSSSSPGPDAGNTVTTNLQNLAALPEEKEPEEVQAITQPVKRPAATPTSTRKSRRTILIEPQEQVPDTTSKISSPRAPPKNIAKRRLEDLRRSLSLEREEKESQIAKKRMSLAVQNTRSNESTSLALLTQDPGPEPSIYTNAATRAKNVRDRVLNGQSCSASINKSLRQKDIEAEVIENQPILARLKDFNNDPYYEEMEWEPIEDEKIMVEVQAVRSELYNTLIQSTDVMMENILELPPEPVRKKQQALYIVVDTNVFLSNLQAIEEARDASFKSFGKPFIVVPWTVIRELDFIKDDKSATRPETLKAKARRAVRFLYQHFSAKHPRVLGQTPADVEKNREIFSLDCPDDEILQNCLQIRQAGRSVVLLSYDKNLCNKAMIHDIVTVGRDDPFEKIDFLNINNMRDEPVHNFHQEKPEIIKAASDEELLVAEDIFEEAKAVILNLVSPVVAKEMYNLFGENWQRYTIVRPPWSTKDVLKCAVKHWMAAVSDSFTKRAESIFKELLEIISNPPDGGRRLKDVSFILERCSDLMQTLKQEKYPQLLENTASAINTLKQKCFAETRRICEMRISEEIGREDDITRQDHRAGVALHLFNRVYAFTRDFCGMAAKAINMPCSFLFDESDGRLNEQFLNNYQPVLAANLNHLLQILSLALEDLNGLRPDHKAIVILAEALATFFPEEFNEPNIEVTPLDLYCLLKNKEDVMKRGLSQLQDLSTQFCQMASFRCK